MVNRYRPFLIASIFIVLSAFPVNIQAAGQLCDQYENPEVRAVVQLVHDAVKLIEKDGKSAFKQFSKKGSKWFKNDVYVYVHSLDGTLVANGAFPELLGSNMIDFRDLTKKLVVRQSIDQVTRYGRESGWVHYLWPVPGQVEPSWKSSYVHLTVGPDGKKYFVGAGLYNAPVEQCFVKSMVNDAALLIERQGAKAFPYIRSRSGPFLWQDTYVFVIDSEGVSLVNPPRPEHEGQNLSKKRDKNGVGIINVLQEAVRDNGFGWAEYQWPKPGLIPASTKRTYARKVRHGGMEYLVGCGLYSE